MYGPISYPGMTPYHPRVALLLFSSPSQSVNARWGWISTPYGSGLDPWELGFRARDVAVVHVWSNFSPRAGALPSPGGAAFIFEPQPISDRPLGLDFLRCTGAV